MSIHPEDQAQGPRAGRCTIQDDHKEADQAGGLRALVSGSTAPPSPGVILRVFVALLALGVAPDLMAQSRPSRAGAASSPSSRPQRSATPAPRVTPRQTQPRQTQPRQAQPRQAQPRQVQPRQVQPRQTQPRQALPQGPRVQPRASSRRSSPVVLPGSSGRSAAPRSPSRVRVLPETSSRSRLPRAERRPVTSTGPALGGTSVRGKPESDPSGLRSSLRERFGLDGGTPSVDEVRRRYGLDSVAGVSLRGNARAAAGRFDARASGKPFARGAARDSEAVGVESIPRGGSPGILPPPRRDARGGGAPTPTVPVPSLPGGGDLVPLPPCHHSHPWSHTSSGWGGPWWCWGGWGWRGAASTPRPT